VAYDEHLADRIRELLASGSPTSEQPMFGGLAFLVDGKISVAASNLGGLLVRVEPDHADQLLATTKAEPMYMRGRAIRGWLHVDRANLRTKRQLCRWITIGTTTAKNR
jgi:TfoX/Sxy family transcriptional regulator of competence genes